MKKGFTLLEILLVVGIITILAGIVIVALNPTKQFASVRNTQRKMNLAELNKALQQYYIDNSRYPTTLTTTLTEICDTEATSTGHSLNCTNKIDLSYLVPTYLVAIPTDPQATGTSTGYKVMIGSNNKIALYSSNAELDSIISLGNVVLTLPYITYNSLPLYIFPVDSDSASGAQWGCSATSIGSNAQSDTNGSANTIAIVASCPTASIAARLCSELSYGGYDDWYLPAKDQLMAMSAQKNSVSTGDYSAQWVNFPLEDYWSSTENPAIPLNAWFVRFYYNASAGDAKGGGRRVRCVRS